MDQFISGPKRMAVRVDNGSVAGLRIKNVNHKGNFSFQSALQNQSQPALWLAASELPL